MKALVYTNPDEMQFMEQADPVCADNEVLLKIDAVGICGSDLHAYHGHDPRRQPGLVLGHEFVGTVVQSRSPLYDVNDRVTGNPLITCGTCDYCIDGRNNLCSNRSMVGMTRPGAFAEFMSIPAPSLIRLPSNMSPVKAALTEPAATAVHAINRAVPHLNRPLVDSRVLILGGGAIGMLAALLLKHSGARHLCLAEVNEGRRNTILRETGASTYDPRSESAPAASFDFVIDAVGSKITRNAALEAVRPGGVIMHIGLQDWASEIDMRKLTLAEITLLGAYTYTQADLRETVRQLEEGVFGDLNWVEERPLKDGAVAFSDISSGQVASAKVVLIP
jgi:2-desacetyl-2-hydroxyethyl bacteriochlorophyllide A dehydrogenase